jgi:hypothetical protein
MRISAEINGNQVPKISDVDAPVTKDTSLYVRQRLPLGFSNDLPGCCKKWPLG